MSNVKSMIAKIQKKYAGAIQDVSVAGSVKRIFLNSPSLNFIFGGGWGAGRIYEFFGPESGGKSTLATYIAGELQKKSTRPMVLYIDFEYSFDAAYANTLGLDTSEEKFILLRPTSGEDGFEIARDLITELPIGLIILDSIATTPSKAQVESAFKATFGGGARVFSEGLKNINPFLAKTGTSLILINQERANIGEMYGPTTKTTGGFAPKYYASWRGRITRMDDIKEKGIVIGIVSKVRNVKNKIGIPKRTAELNLKFASGFEADQEYVGFLIDLGIVEQRGAWFYNSEWDMKVNGRDAVFAFLKERPDIFSQAKNSVDAMMMNATLLDKDTDVGEDSDEVDE